VVPLPDARPDPGTVMVVNCHTNVTFITMVNSGGLYDMASGAFLQSYFLDLLLTFTTILLVIIGDANLIHFYLLFSVFALSFLTVPDTLVDDHFPLLTGDIGH